MNKSALQKMNPAEIFVSYYSKTWVTKPVKRLQLSIVFSSEWRKQFTSLTSEIDQYLSSGDSKLFEKRKAELPCISYSGTFLRRSSDFIEHYSGVVVLDFDNVNWASRKDEFKRVLNDDPYLIFWELSVSGDGLKIVIFHDGGIEKHQDVFKAGCNYYEQLLELKADRSVKDVSRAHYLCYREGLHGEFQGLKIFPLTSRNENNHLIDGYKEKRLTDFSRLSAKEIEDVYESLKAVAETRLNNGLVDGNRNSFLFRLVGMLVARSIPKHAVYDLLLQDGLSAGLQKSEILSIIEKGYSKPPKYLFKSNELDRYQCIMSCLLEGEDGDSKLISRFQKGRLSYIEELNLWVENKGGKFQPVSKLKLRNRYANVLKALYYELYQKVVRPNIVKSYTKDSVVSGQNAKQHSQAFYYSLELKLNRRRANLNSLTYQKHVMELLMAKCLAAKEDFDSDPNQLNCTNGVLELDSQTFYLHSGEDRFMKQLGVAYDYKAQCPQWIEFINKIYRGDQALISYVQKVIAYWLTADTSEQKFWYLYGSGANGKSTMMDVIFHVMGDYCQKIDVGCLLNTSTETQRGEYYAIMRGIRLAVFSEMPEGKELNVEAIKELTGGEIVSGRQIRKSPFKFKPTAKLVFIANHLSGLGTIDKAIERRIEVIPHYFIVDDKEKDENLSAKLKSESPGILNWIIEGMEKLRKEKLQAPIAVQEATRAYLYSIDDLGHFLEDATVEASPSEKIRILANQLYRHYCEYCAYNKEAPKYKQQSTFYAALGSKGYRVYRGGKNKRYVDNLRISDFKSPV
jgi:P4 family phage/plasmid primase-like protien